MPTGERPRGLPLCQQPVLEGRRPAHGSGPVHRYACAANGIQKAGLWLFCEMCRYPVSLAVIRSKNKLTRLPNKLAIVALGKNPQIGKQEPV